MGFLLRARNMACLLHFYFPDGFDAERHEKRPIPNLVFIDTFEQPFFIRLSVKK